MIQGALFLPETSWVPHTGPLPKIRGCRVGVDTETRDKGLAMGMGPGWVHGDGHVAGVSVSWSGNTLYIPVQHPDTECRSKLEVAAWLDDIFANCEIVFHNMGYDMPWLQNLGVTVWPTRAHDTYVACVLLNENLRSYDLDACCAWQGLPGKDDQLLREVLAAHGVAPANFKASLWLLPAKFVGPYAGQDAAATLELWERVRPQLLQDRLSAAYQTEIDLVPIVVAMRRRGIRVNLDVADQTRTLVRQKCKDVLAEIGRRTGRRVSMQDMLSPDALAVLMDKEGLSYPMTPKTKKPSFKKEWLESQNHWLPEMVREARQTNDLAEKFIGTYIIDFAHMDRIHAEIHQLRDTDAGTRTFRFSYSNPPLQQMPARDEVLAPLIRRIFESEFGTVWGALDYSQQEYRMAVEFAVRCKIPSANVPAQLYIDNPNVDFHQMIADITGVARKSAKIINLAMLYGMGLDKLARSLNISLEDAQDLMDLYHRRNPWIRALTEECERLAGQRGWIRLIDGARCHFDNWQPRNSRSDYSLSHDLARKEWPDSILVRAGTRKAMNRLSQGSAARQTKRAMVQCYREGYLPLIQMHDELGFPFTNEADARRCVEIMTSAVPTSVPFMVDAEFGTNWGDATSKIWPLAA